MKRMIQILLVTACACTMAWAQDGAATMQGGAAATPPYVTDLLGQIGFVEGQITSLMEAMPQDKFSWRPMEGVRSVGEVYRHITFGNYILMQLAGYPPPASANFTTDMQKWDTAVTDKAQIGAAMKASFDFVKATASKLTEADLAKEVNLFGNKMTLRSATMTTLSHMHEHLGQSIAYARMNKVVPPWTASEGQSSGKAEGK
jgi:uncharacterized damage-inducible protein DinB